jgi:hypothetical protein
MASYTYAFEKGVFDKTAFMEIEGSCYSPGAPGRQGAPEGTITLSGNPVTTTAPHGAMVLMNDLSCIGAKDFFIGTHALTGSVNVNGATKAGGSLGTVHDQPVVGVLYNFEQHKAQLGGHQSNSGVQQSLTSYFLATPDTSISGRLSGAYGGTASGFQSLSVYENRSQLSGFAAVITTAISADFTVAVVGLCGAGVVYDVKPCTGGSLMPGISSGTVYRPKQTAGGNLSARGPGTETFFVGPETRRKVQLGYL